MNREKVRMYVKRYCELRDVQFAAYELYARKHGLTAKELFVLDIIWFSEDGCLQSVIRHQADCQRHCQKILESGIPVPDRVGDGPPQ